MHGKILDPVVYLLTLLCVDKWSLLSTDFTQALSLVFKYACKFEKMKYVLFVAETDMPIFLFKGF